MRKIHFTEEQIKHIIKESVNEFQAYHASPNNFDKFNHKKYLGQGCGSQVFGWGTYITDDPYVANGYMDAFKKEHTITVDGQQIKDPRQLAKVLGLPYDDTILHAYRLLSQRGEKIFYERYEEFIAIERRMRSNGEDESKKDSYNHVCQAIKVFELLLNDHETHSEITKPYLYEVDIPDDNGNNYIDWYEQFPHEFMYRILKKLFSLKKSYLDIMAKNSYNFKSGLYFYINGDKSLYDRLIDLISNEDDYRTFFNQGTSTSERRPVGKDVYHTLQEWLGSPKGASLFLLQCGFDGIKYESGTRMNKPDGASENAENYVIFNASKVKILKKNNG